MKETNPKIHIVGAGVSGLIAAKTLEKHGFQPVVLEEDERIGGRVKTDEVDGVCFDHGFQVLLTAYPQVQKHLDLSKLDLNYFKPGALLFDSGKTQRIGDPLRDISALWPTLISSAGTLRDKIKIFTLSQKLKNKTITAIFEEKETTTLNYLRDYGFSDTIIRRFFKPFFTGIFLENTLSTSSRMFEFVFKMFGEGYAAVPSKGIGAIVYQLASKLKNTKFELGKRVTQAKNGKMVLNSGDTLDTHGTIITSPLAEAGEASAKIQWKSCHNLYFETEKRVFDTGIIGLVSREETLTNNLHYLFGSDVPILSVTVVKEHELSVGVLAKKVSEELLRHCGINTKKLLRHYHIREALPDISDIKTKPRAGVDAAGTITAGDYTLNGSLNAAMVSGEAAAENLVDYLGAS